jgi:hypothetical protein
MPRTRTPIAFREAQDAAIINANAGRLNREAMDVLGYQGLPVGPRRPAQNHAAKELLGNRLTGDSASMPRKRKPLCIKGGQ